MGQFQVLKPKRLFFFSKTGSSYHKKKVEKLKEFYLNKKIFVSCGHLSLFWHLQLEYSAI